MPHLIAPLIVSGFAAAGATVSLATATTLATVGLYATTAIAQYAIQAAMQPERKIGTKISIAFGGDVEQSVPIGECETAGSLVYAGSWGFADATPNAYFVRVVVASDMPIDGVRPRIWWNNEKHTIDWGEERIVNGHSIGSPVTSLREGDKDMAWVKYLDGSQTVADPYLRDKFGDAERPWKSTMIGRGRAIIIITTRYDKKEPEGLPTVKFVVRGIHLYNPKNDSTNGGSGAHRWGNRSTYEYDDNSAVVAYNLERGIYFNGKWMMGGRNLPAFLLDNDSFTASINVCNENVDLKNGGTEKRYRMGAEFSLASTGYEILDTIRSTCSGRASEAGGVLYFDVGGIGAASYSITDDDIVVTQQQDSVVSPSLSQRVNTITGTYTEPDNGGDAKALRPKTVASYVEEDDGQELSVSVSLRAVRSNTQGQRVINYQLNDNRRSRTHNIVLGPAFRGLRSGKVINWTSARYQYSNKKFICGDVKILAAGLVVTSIREADPTDADWSTLKEDDFIVGVYGRIVPPAQRMHLTATPVAIRNNAGKNKRAGIKATWTKGDDDVDWKRTSVRVRLTDTHEIVARETTDADELEIIFEKGIVRNEAYQVSGKIIPESDRETEWSDWEDVTAPDVKTDDDDVELPLMRAEIQAEIDTVSSDVGSVADDLAAEVVTRAAAIAAAADALALETQARADGAFEASDRFRDLMSELRGVAAEAMGQGLNAYTQKEELRQTLTTKINSTYAEFDQRIVVAVSDNAALAARTTTLEVGTATLTASVNTVDLARIAGDEALALQITSLSAGTSSQFDHVEMWYFDAGVESWSGNGTPTHAGTFLRPADDASDPYVASPAPLDVDGAVYSQVRARIKKIGTPTWQGYLYWKAGSDTTWDAGRRDTISAPTFDGDGYGLITFNSAWAGTINQIRLDLSTAQTATDYMLIDWVAIGRPSPGASSAELAEVKQAQIDGDAAIASDILTLDVRLNDAETGIDLVSSAVTAVETSVEDLGDSLVAQGTILDGLSTEIDGKASITSVDELSNEITDFGGADGVLSIGAAVRAIRNQIDPIATLASDSAFAAYLRSQDIRQAVALANQVLSTRIETTATSLTVVSQAVTSLQASVPNFADASALQSLTTRVSVTESSIVSLSTFTTSLSATVAGKADGSALTTLTTRVTAAEGTIASHSTSLTSLNSTVAGKADSSALTALTTRVTTAEGDITSIGSAITALDTEIDGKASSTAVNALTTRVTETETVANSKAKVFRQASAPTATGSGDIWFDSDDGDKPYRWNGTVWAPVDDKRVPDLVTVTNSQAAAITSINSSLANKANASAVTTLTTRVSDVEDEVTAVASAVTDLFAGDGSDFSSVRVKMKAVSGAPTGWARYAIQVRSGASDAFASAGFFMDAKNDGSDSRIVLDAEKIVFRNGGSLTGSPFKIVGGNVYLDNVNIGDAIIDDLQVGSINIVPLAVTGGKIDTDAVTTPKVLANTIETHVDISGTKTQHYSNANASGWVDLPGATVTIVNTNPSTVVLEFDWSMSCDMDPDNIITAFGAASMSVRLVSAAAPIDTESKSGVSPNSGLYSISSSGKIFLVDTYASPANRTYKIQYNIESVAAQCQYDFTINASASLVWWKR